MSKNRVIKEGKNTIPEEYELEEPKEQPVSFDFKCPYFGENNKMEFAFLTIVGTGGLFTISYMVIKYLISL